MVSDALTRLCQRLAEALNDLRPDIPDCYEPTIVLIDPNDPQRTLLVGKVDHAALLEHLSWLACDPSKHIGIVSESDVDFAPTPKVN